MGQGIRDFVAGYERAFPGEVVHVTEPVTTDYDVMALVLEYERRRRWPILLFEKVAGASMPIIANVVASRKALAWALGVPEARLAQEYARRIKDTIKPTTVARAPFHERVLTGADLDLGRLPIPTYFPGDAGTLPDGRHAGRARSRDGRGDRGLPPLSGERPRPHGREPPLAPPHVRVPAPRRGARPGARRARSPSACTRSCRWARSPTRPPRSASSRWSAGSSASRSRSRPCTSIDLTVPAAAEIVIEGEILPGVREPEGPFGEFTGYFSRRSTEHVFQAKAISMRAGPWFQSIGSGRAGDHITTLALVREAEIWNALRRVIPNVTGVHVPLSGTSSFSAYVAIKQGRPGEAKHVIPIVLGVDHYLKLVIVVDDDIDVFDESDVMWAVATRMQADRDLVTIGGSLGALLDPSADERGVTAKLGIDATRPFGEPFAAKLVMDPAKMAWARGLVDRLGG